MTVVEAPTVLASRSSLGVIPSTARGNVSWSDDGQCLYITKRNVHIITPYLATTLPPPPSLVDPNLSLEHPSQTVYRANHPRASAVAPVTNLEPESGPSTRLRRPATGEIPMYATSIEVESQSSRDAEYGWKDAGDEMSTPPIGTESHIRAASWSPSGCTELGGCMLAIMMNTGQVTVWSPRSDPTSKHWDETADLTGQLARLLENEEGEDMTVRRMLQLRSTCMTWARLLPSASQRDPVSILAVGNRAGELHLWILNRNGEFKRALVAALATTWISHVSCSSSWRSHRSADGRDTWASDVLGASADGSIYRVSISISSAPSSDFILEVLETIVITGPDKRPVTSLLSTTDVDVWTKAGTVHLSFATPGSQASWKGVKTVQLDRVGNWAGANPFCPCVGIQLLSRDRLVIVLSSLTHHIIENLLTAPGLADPVDSLRASLAARDVLLDFSHSESLKKDRLRMSVSEDRDVTAHTIGWESVSADGAVVSYLTEPINFHNLDAATEGHRFLLFSIVDMSATLPAMGSGPLDTVEQLAAVLAKPPSLYDASPSRVLFPIFAQALGLSGPERVAADLLRLCDAAEMPTLGPLGASALDALHRTLWTSRELDSVRLKLVTSLWCSTVLHSGQAIAAKKLCSNLRRGLHLALLATIVQWIEAQPGSSVTPLDRRMLTALRHAVGNRSAPTTDASPSEQSCPACKEPISGGDIDEAKCTKAHTWSRCSLTQLIITDPIYRVCMTCSAVALVPGLPELQGSIAKNVLECATHCIVCGGRWMKAI